MAAGTGLVNTVPTWAEGGAGREDPQPVNETAATTAIRSAATAFIGERPQMMPLPTLRLQSSV